MSIKNRSRTKMPSATNDRKCRMGLACKALMVSRLGNKGLTFDPLSGSEKLCANDVNGVWLPIQRWCGNVESENGNAILVAVSNVMHAASKIPFDYLNNNNSTPVIQLETFDFEP